ncbi:MAG: RagB/SusD family nutrient uptake outer membrane protein [Rhodothermales bacterium]
MNRPADPPRPRFGRPRLFFSFVCLALLGLLLSVTACDDLLAVEDPVNLTPDDLSGDAPLSLTTNGARGAFQSMVDYYALHTALLTDEMVLAGTFPYRGEIDDRAIPDNNEGLLNDFYSPLSTSRFMADTAIVILEAARGNPAYDEDEINDGVAMARYFGGYTRLLLAEGFCASPINGGPALTPEERMQDAISVFTEAEADAQRAGDADLAAAAKLGRARAHLWLRNFEEAAALAAEIPADLDVRSYYANASIPQKNKIARFTWAIDEVIRWTVGDGTLAFTGNERWPYFDEWVDLGLIVPRPDLESFNPAVPVNLQQKYPAGDTPITLASGAEADLIEAEARLRAGNLAGAAALVNALRQSHWSLPPITFTGTLTTNLEIMAQERARELWLTGERIATLRRYLEDGVDLFPAGKLGTETCFPLPQRETDTNPNL